MSTIEAPRGSTARPTSKERGSSSLERVTVNLTPRSSEALDRAVDLTQDSKTDTINRALQTYAYLMAAVSQGGTVYIGTGDKPDLEKIHFL